MRTLLKIGLGLCCTFIFQGPLFAQESEVERPTVMVVTHNYFDYDREDFDMEDWKKIEKEYIDKVIRKNEHIMGGGYYLHNLTEDSREVVNVVLYKDWNSVDQASQRNGELAREAWPEDEARMKFMRNRGSYFIPRHSDEIYRPGRRAKAMPEEEFKTEKIVLVQRRHIKGVRHMEEGDGDFINEYIENVIHPNEYILGYYPNTHLYGADSTEFLEAFYLNSMEDMDKMYERWDELEAAYLDTEEKKARMKEVSKRVFEPLHRDYVYTMVPDLRLK